MRINRIYQNCDLVVDETIQLDAESTNHIVNVLRLTQDTPLILFNGQGGEFSATVSQIEKRKAFVRVDKFFDIERESPLQIHLAQAISRTEKMDLTIQKAVELGVQQITPMITERCGVKLSKDRWQKRFDHWYKIIISACEQCGRNKIPTLNPITNFSDFLNIDASMPRLIFHHDADKTFASLEKSYREITLLIGPEGGFSDDEIAAAIKQQCTSIKLGPRVLRTETAGIAAIATLQSKYGDFL